MPAAHQADEVPQDRFQRLLEQHQRIVFKVAGTYCGHAEDRRDLVQEISAQPWRSFATYGPPASAGDTPPRSRPALVTRSPGWIHWSLLIGAVVSGLILVLPRLLLRTPGDARFLRRIADDVAGCGLRGASRQIDEIARFAREPL
jgi:Sigma-70 region 2